MSIVKPASDSEQNDERLPLTCLRPSAVSVPVISTVVACVFIALFKASAEWPLLGGSAHLFIFWPPMLILIFLTSFRAFRKVNVYVAENITDHSLVKRIAEKRIASFIVAIGLAVTLSSSMAIFVYTMSWRTLPIVAGGFAIVAWLIHAFSLRGYLKQAVAEVSKGYVAVGAASLLMVVSYMAMTIFGEIIEFDPLSPELIEYVRETVKHPNYAFESVARTMVFWNMNILSLGNVEGFTRSVVVVLILLTTSAVPFVSLALFMRSLYEVILNFAVIREHRADEQT